VNAVDFQVYKDYMHSICFMGVKHLINFDLEAIGIRFVTQPMKVVKLVKVVGNTTINLAHVFHTCSCGYERSSSCIINKDNSCSLWHYILGHVPCLN